MVFSKPRSLETDCSQRAVTLSLFGIQDLFVWVHIGSGWTVEAVELSLAEWGHCCCGFGARFRMIFVPISGFGSDYVCSAC
jgi:hypothetical protein